MLSRDSSRAFQFPGGRNRWVTAAGLEPRYEGLRQPSSPSELSFGQIVVGQVFREHGDYIPSRNVFVQTEYSVLHIGTQTGQWQNGGMRKGPSDPRHRKHFLAQWRNYRGYNQVQLAECMGITQGQLSKFENFKKPLDEDIMGIAAEALRCAPADIMMRNPMQPQPFWSIWEDVPAKDREQVLAVLKTFATKTGTEG